MRNFKAKLAILSILVLMLPATNFAKTKKAKNNNLSISGKILNRQKADITIYIEKDGGWIKVITIQSKTRYVLDLTPENNYYVLFENNEGKTKTLYLDAGEPGAWETKLNIDFKDSKDNFAKFYKHPIYDEYVFRILKSADFEKVTYHKNILALLINKLSVV